MGFSLIFYQFIQYISYPRGIMDLPLLSFMGGFRHQVLCWLSRSSVVWVKVTYEHVEIRRLSPRVLLDASTCGDELI